MVIGVTGGIGTGKSESIKFFMKYGAEIIDCDLISKEVSESKEMIEKLKEVFGDEIVKTGKLDRKKLREIVFNDKEKLLNLNSLMHPLILFKVREEIKNRSKNKNIVIVEMPLLFEVGFETEVEKTVVISAPFELQLERVIKRDSLNYDEAVKAISAQIKKKKKIKKADFVIENGGSKKELGDKIFELISKLKEDN